MSVDVFFSNRESIAKSSIHMTFKYFSETSFTIKYNL